MNSTRRKMSGGVLAASLKQSERIERNSTLRSLGLRG